MTFSISIVWNAISLPTTMLSISFYTNQVFEAKMKLGWENEGDVSVTKMVMCVPISVSHRIFKSHFCLECVSLYRPSSCSFQHLILLVLGKKRDGEKTNIAFSSFVRLSCRFGGKEFFLWSHFFYFRIVIYLIERENEINLRQITQ